ncbi:MAG: hypothetical protein GY796_25240, partial [Chloroflexi bacterium]|nr:hypothetical protein [Chloroflexota bacterium]
SGANVQATATDAAGNTSEFSSGPPQISHVDPVDAVPGMNDLGVNIFGAGFRDNDPIGVDFGADVYVNQIIYHGPDHVTAYIDVDPAAALGLRDVTLTNYDGQWDTLVGGFEIVSTPPPPPVVTAVTPDEAAPDTNGALYISGADFIDRPVITFSGPITVVWTQFNDPTEIVIEVVVADTAVPGSSYDLTLTNPDGQSDTLLNAITIVNPYFTDVAPAHNVDVSSGEHGAAWGDLDGDGWLDLAIGSGELFTSTAASFNDATAAAGLDPIGYFGGVAWADHDNDSDLNLLSSWAKVYRQNSLPFSKIWDDSSNQPTLAWVDYDLDGDVDVYASGQLYRQDGSATFTNVTTASGLSISMADEWLSSVWADYDDDGNPDLYLTCNGCPNLLFHNNGNGTFTDVTTAAGVGDTGSGHGANWADYDNDGDFDLFIANNNDQYNVLYRNDGAGTFTDVSAAAGFHDQTNNGTGTNWLDYNLDGWIDVFVVNRYHENRLYRNNGDGTFTDYRMASGVNDGRDSEGSTVGDYDNDGDPDIYVVSGSDGDGTPNFLYENNVSGQHWLKVKLEGVLSNHSAIGAIIKIYGAGPIQTRQIAGSNGYMSQDALEAIFGLGSYAGQVTIEVIWPSTVVDTISAVAADQEIVIVESTTYLHDLGMVGILPANPLPANVPFAPLATVRNFGQNTETGASVQCQISHGGTTVYNQTLTAGPITPAAWASISFLNYTPTTSGTYTIQCTVTIAGDERPLNDSLTQTFDVTQQIADAWTKDNDHDDGNVPSGSNNWYGSPDVWVRWAADGGLVHQDPIAGQTNTVYVRLRNRGNVTITGTLDVTWIEPSLGTRCGDWAPIGTVAFNNLLPGEQRIVSLPWVPTRSGHTCMQSIIDSPADPYDRGLECSPQWVPWDNNISWRNINIFHNPTTRGVTDIKTADVRLVNVYAQSKDVDLVVDRMTFPKTDTLTVLLPADLFDRWWNYGRGWQDNITVDPTTREIIVTGDISGTIGAIPMTADEEVTVTLRFDGQTGLEFEMGIRERIDGVTMGGVGYQWIIPDTTTPTVVSVTPTDSMSDVALAAPIVMTFDEEIGPLSVVLTANPPLNNPSPTWNDAGTVFTVTHSGLTEGTVYALSVMANDAAGNPLSTPHTWSFTTMSTGYELYLPVLLKP